MRTFWKNVAIKVLSAVPQKWAVSLVCWVRTSRMSFGDYACNVCGASFPAFQPRPSRTTQRVLYGLSAGIDPFDNPLDRARGSDRRFCPRCGEAERERFLFFLFEGHITLAKTARVLHTSPGPFAQRALQKKYRYISSDYRGSPLMTRKEDLCNLRFADASLDAVISFHVLEHVIDDRLALSEIRRVLRPGGAAIICVPADLSLSTTIDDTSLSREDRVRRFGHPEHHRLYGLDFVDRLEAAGFEVTEFEPRRVVPALVYERLGLLESDRIWLCRRPT
jgi:SAM-dependent methyltransferase